ncbi:MAG: Flp pilus assembly complex ATPase component TadA [Fimbriimonadaceae bacterium]|nr:Flp pilus assembly complex ATPase component TadA [Chthonomonadaceae bacterium]MCO5296540.1 Flp pilus assembly complex ATPase component TadA [Fimbriimonadaceae bacterium]
MNLDRSISDIFVEEGYVTREELNQILAERADTLEPVGDLLVRLKKITEKQKLKCVGLQMGVPFVDLANHELDISTARIITHPVAIRLLSIPIEKTDIAASVAMVNPLDLAAIDDLAALTGLDIDPMLATEEDIRDAIFRSFGAYDDLGEIVGEAVKGLDKDGLRMAGEDEEEEEQVNVVELKEIVEGAPVIKLANILLTRAISMRASDIHVEPHQRRVRVRFRIDGLLQEVMSIPKDLQHPLVSRIKILANLDIAERRVPQDGRCTMVSHQGEYDFRVSTYPSVFGENVVIRILDKHAATIDLNKLGMSAENKTRLIPKIEEPQGLIIVTGPTGSGKTTTLYAALHHLNAVHRNIVTVEDPVEYQLEGIIQANVNPRAGISFATGLRSILRQDPDVILVGEVRDGETASIAVEAALTGHLVLTSLHSNDSAAAITRLMDMGIEPFLIGSSITCSVAQRLVRASCPKCLETYEPEPEVLAKLNLPTDVPYRRGRGCEYCAKTGYRGRMGIYEVLDVSSDVRRMILTGNHAAEIRDQAERQGMTTLRNDARAKVLEGTTTIEEVIRVTADGM